jgi:hypothetical protein
MAPPRYQSDFLGLSMADRSASRSCPGTLFSPVVLGTRPALRPGVAGEVPHALDGHHRSISWALHALARVWILLSGCRCADHRFDGASGCSALHKTQNSLQSMERFPCPLVGSVGRAAADFSAARGGTLVHYRQIHDPNMYCAGKHTAPGPYLAAQTTCFCSAV